MSDKTLVPEVIPTKKTAGSGLIHPSKATVVPTVVTREGPMAEKRYLEFFAANIRNKNTREAYFRACHRFLTWCGNGGLELVDIEPIHVAAYIELLGQEFSAPTVKQHLAGIRMMFDWLVTGQVVAHNPSAAVRGPKHRVKIGKTPVLTAKEAGRLIESIDVSNVVGLRDRALIGMMIYSFARVGAVCAMKAKDYFPKGEKRYWFRLHEKGGKYHELPAHHKAEEYMDAYLQVAGTAEEKGSPLFRSTRGRTGTLTDRGLSRVDVYRMIRRRGLAAGLDGAVCCHTFRATGITVFLENGGQLETAAQIAAHESTRTTQLYDRTGDEIKLEEIERVRI